MPAKHRQGNTDRSRLENSLLQFWMKSGVVDTVHGTVRFPRELLVHVNGTLHKRQELFNLKLADMLPDKAKIRYLVYHLDKSCLQVTLILVKLVSQLPGRRM